MADGTTYDDAMTPTSTVAWFVFRVDPNQSYSIEVWSPFGKFGDIGNAVYLAGPFEFDGTTLIATASRPLDFPSPQVEPGLTQGERHTFINSGSARRLAVEVHWTSGAPSATVYFAIRIVTTTLASTRWSVNGYSDFIALSNVASTDGVSSITGSILYFNEAGTLVGSDPFSLGPDASVQIVKPNGVAIGGALKGGIRVVHDGAPGAILAHQLWFNPVTNAYIQYPFVPLVHSYGRGAI